MQGKKPTGESAPEMGWVETQLGERCGEPTKRQYPGYGRWVAEHAEVALGSGSHRRDRELGR